MSKHLTKKETRKNTVYQKLILGSLIFTISISVMMFQNCARPTAIKLTDAASKVNSVNQQSKDVENFDVFVPSSITIAPGQEIPDIEVEVSKTGIGTSEIVLKNGNYNQALNVGALFNAKEKEPQKHNHFVKVKNLNKNQPGSVTVQLDFDVLDEKKVVTQRIHKTVIINISSKPVLGIDYSEVAKCGAAAGNRSITGSMTQLESNYKGSLCGTDKANSSLLKSGSIEWTGSSLSMVAVNSVSTSNGGAYADLFSQPFTAASNAPIVVQWQCLGKDKNGILDASKLISCHARTPVVAPPPPVVAPPPPVVAPPPPVVAPPPPVVAPPPPVVAPTCPGISSIRAQLTAKAKFFDLDIKLQGAVSTFALPGPGFSTRYTLQFFKNNNILMTIAELRMCLISPSINDAGRISIEHSYSRRRNDGTQFAFNETLSISGVDFNTLEFSSYPWGSSKITVQTTLGQIEATSNPIYSIPECTTVFPQTMSVNSSGKLEGTMYPPDQSSYPNIDRSRVVAVVYHCGNLDYQFGSPIVGGAPQIEYVHSQLNYCPVLFGYYVRFMYLNAVGDPQCISREFNYTSN